MPKRRFFAAFSKSKTPQPSGLLSQPDNFITPSQLNGLVSTLQNDQYNADIIRFLNKNQSSTIDFITEFSTTLQEIKKISDLGLQTTFKEKVIQDPAFQKLLSKKKNCEILLSLSALANLPDNKLSKLDPNIFRVLKSPLFSDKNTATNNSFTGYFSGVLTKINGVDSITGRNNTILADLFFNVTPNFLCVQNNGHNKIPLDDATVNNDLAFYKKLSKNLTDIAASHKLDLIPKTNGERCLEEGYDSAKWSEYKQRFKEFEKIHNGINPPDTLGNNALSKIGKQTADTILSGDALLTSHISHFALDPKHLASVLGSDYGSFRGKFFEIIDALESTPEKNYQYKINGRQLFQRLKLLEFELYKECEIIQIAPQAKKDNYQKYMAKFHPSLAKTVAVNNSPNISPAVKAFKNAAAGNLVRQCKSSDSQVSKLTSPLSTATGESPIQTMLIDLTKSINNLDPNAPPGRKFQAFQRQAELVEKIQKEGIEFKQIGKPVVKNGITIITWQDPSNTTPSNNIIYKIKDGKTTVEYGANSSALIFSKPHERQGASFVEINNGKVTNKAISKGSTLDVKCSTPNFQNRVTNKGLNR
jgi:hypothetical protein